MSFRHRFPNLELTAMSDKHASEKTPKANYDQIAERELDDASNALFDEFS